MRQETAADGVATMVAVGRVARPGRGAGVGPGEMGRRDAVSWRQLIDSTAVPSVLSPLCPALTFHAAHSFPGTPCTGEVGQASAPPVPSVFPRLPPYQQPQLREHLLCARHAARDCTRV